MFIIANPYAANLVVYATINASSFWSEAKKINQWGKDASQQKVEMGVSVVGNISEIKAEAKRITQAAVGTSKVLVPIEINSKGVEAQVKKISDDLSGKNNKVVIPITLKLATGELKSARNQLAASGQLTISLPVSINTTKATGELRSFIRNMTNTERVNIKVGTTFDIVDKKRISDSLQMMGNSLEVKVPVKPYLVLSDFNKQLRDFSKELKEKIEALSRGVDIDVKIDSSKSDTDKIEKELNGLNDSAENSRGAFDGLKETIMGVFGGNLLYDGIARIKNIASEAAIGFNSMREQANIGFTQMLGGATQAKDMMGKLADLANFTPFELKDLIPLAQQMSTFGTAVSDIIPNIKAIGDQVAALGGSSYVLERITRALGQIQLKGRLQGDELLQLNEAGVKAQDYVANALGKDPSQLLKDMAKQNGAVPADVAVKAILDGMKKDFGGMMEEQSKTFQGAMSTIKDSLTRLFADMFLPAYTEISKLSYSLGTAFSGSGFQESGKKMAELFGGKVQDVIGIVHILSDVVTENKVITIAAIALISASYFKLGTVISNNPVVAVLLLAEGLRSFSQGSGIASRAAGMLSTGIYAIVGAVAAATVAQKAWAVAQAQLEFIGGLKYVAALRVGLFQYFTLIKAGISSQLAFTSANQATSFALGIKTISVRSLMVSLFGLTEAEAATVATSTLLLGGLALLVTGIAAVTLAVSVGVLAWGEYTNRAKQVEIANSIVEDSNKKTAATFKDIGIDSQSSSEKTKTMLSDLSDAYQQAQGDAEKMAQFAKSVQFDKAAYSIKFDASLNQDSKKVLLLDVKIAKAEAEQDAIKLKVVSDIKDQAGFFNSFKAAIENIGKSADQVGYNLGKSLLGLNDENYRSKLFKEDNNELMGAAISNKNIDLLRKQREALRKSQEEVNKAVNNFDSKGLEAKLKESKKQWDDYRSSVVGLIGDMDNFGKRTTVAATALKLIEEGFDKISPSAYKSALAIASVVDKMKDAASTRDFFQGQIDSTEASLTGTGKATEDLRAGINRFVERFNKQFSSDDLYKNGMKYGQNGLAVAATQTDRIEQLLASIAENTAKMAGTTGAAGSAGAGTLGASSASAEGNQIAAAAMEMQTSGKAQGFVHQCQALARTAVQKVTHEFDGFFKGSAAETEEAFKKAKKGFAYQPGMQLLPGDLAYSGSKYGNGAGHAQTVGQGGKFLDQYGVHAKPTTPPEWIVRPGTLNNGLGEAGMEKQNFQRTEFEWSDKFKKLAQENEKVKTLVRKSFGADWGNFYQEMARTKENRKKLIALATPTTRTVSRVVDIDPKPNYYTDQFGNVVQSGTSEGASRTVVNTSRGYGSNFDFGGFKKQNYSRMVPSSSSYGVDNNALFKAIVGNESGGNPKSVNKDTGALGLGQVMPANIASWTKEAMGKSMTPAQYLNDRAAQVKTIEFELGKMMKAQLAKTGGDADLAVRRVAAQWYSGGAGNYNSQKPQNGYPTIAAYTLDIAKRYREAAGTSRPQDSDFALQTQTQKNDDFFRGRLSGIGRVQFDKLRNSYDADKMRRIPEVAEDGSNRNTIEAMKFVAKDGASSLYGKGGMYQRSGFSAAQIKQEADAYVRLNGIMTDAVAIQERYNAQRRTVLRDGNQLVLDKKREAETTNSVTQSIMSNAANYRDLNDIVLRASIAQKVFADSSKSSMGIMEKTREISKRYNAEMVSQSANEKNKAALEYASTLLAVNKQVVALGDKTRMAQFGRDIREQFKDAPEIGARIKELKIYADLIGDFSNQSANLRNHIKDTQRQTEDIGLGGDPILMGFAAQNRADADKASDWTTVQKMVGKDWNNPQRYAERDPENGGMDDKQRAAVDKMKETLRLRQVDFEKTLDQIKAQREYNNVLAQATQERSSGTTIGDLLGSRAAGEEQVRMITRFVDYQQKIGKYTDEQKRSADDYLMTLDATLPKLDNLVATFEKMRRAAQIGFVAMANATEFGGSLNGLANDSIGATSAINQQQKSVNDNPTGRELNQIEQAEVTRSALEQRYVQLTKSSFADPKSLEVLARIRKEYEQIVPLTQQLVVSQLSQSTAALNKQFENQVRILKEQPGVMREIMTQRIEMESKFRDSHGVISPEAQAAIEKYLETSKQVAEFNRTQSQLEDINSENRSRMSRFVRRDTSKPESFGIDEYSLNSIKAQKQAAEDAIHSIKGLTPEETDNLLGVQNWLDSAEKYRATIETFRDSINNVFSDGFKSLYENGPGGFFKSVVSGFADMISQIGQQALKATFLKQVNSLFGLDDPNSNVNKAAGGVLGAEKPKGDAKDKQDTVQTILGGVAQRAKDKITGKEGGAGVIKGNPEENLLTAANLSTASANVMAETSGVFKTSIDVFAEAVKVMATAQGADASSISTAQSASASTVGVLSGAFSIYDAIKKKGGDGLIGTVAGWLGNKHQSGLDYVPYDNYPALLHTGEKVITASAATLSRGSNNSDKINSGLVNASSQNNYASNHTSNSVHIGNVNIEHVANLEDLVSQAQEKAGTASRGEQDKEVARQSGSGQSRIR